MRVDMRISRGTQPPRYEESDKDGRVRIAFTHNLQTSHDEAEAEFDREETVAAIADGIRALGHDVVRVNVGAGGASQLVRRLEEIAPDLVFNTAEGTHGRFR